MEGSRFRASAGPVLVSDRALTTEGRANRRLREWPGGRPKPLGFSREAACYCALGSYGHWAKLRKGGIDKPQSGSRPAR